MNADRLPPGAELLPPPTPDERHLINELMRAPRAYTHPVTFNAKNPHLGTAVFLRHGERLFAFTAAHNIHADTTIIFRLGSDSGRTRFDVLHTYIHPKYDSKADVSKFDLAILELEPNPAVAAGDIVQLYAGGFGRLPEGEPRLVSNAFVWVVGYPAELAEVGKDHTVLKQTAFATQILEHDSDEFSVSYPESVYRMPHDGVSCELGDMTKTPKGYSGGVWVVGNPPGQMFNPLRHIKLIGIQSHWSPTPRLARCVPGKVIADSLKSFRPDVCPS